MFDPCEPLLGSICNDLPVTNKGRTAVMSMVNSEDVHSVGQNCMLHEASQQDQAAIKNQLPLGRVRVVYQSNMSSTSSPGFDKETAIGGQFNFRSINQTTNDGDAAGRSRQARPSMGGHWLDALLLPVASQLDSLSARISAHAAVDFGRLSVLWRTLSRQFIAGLIF